MWENTLKFELSSGKEKNVGCTLFCFNELILRKMEFVLTRSCHAAQPKFFVAPYVCTAQRVYHHCTVRVYVRMIEYIICEYVRTCCTCTVPVRTTTSTDT